MFRFCVEYKVVSNHRAWVVLAPNEEAAKIKFLDISSLPEASIVKIHNWGSV